MHIALVYVAIVVTMRVGSVVHAPLRENHRGTVEVLIAWKELANRLIIKKLIR